MLSQVRFFWSDDILLRWDEPLKISCLPDGLSGVIQ